LVFLSILHSSHIVRGWLALLDMTVQARVIYVGSL